MKFIDIEQNTPEWLEWRKSGIGASEAAVLMGTSKWKTPYELWEDKLGRSEPKPMNQWQRRGHDLEPVARDFYSQRVNSLMMPKCAVHAQYDWILASFDAVDLFGSKIAEIKCPGPRDHKLAQEGKIPAHYYPQLQHQMWVAGLDEIDYVSFDGEELIVLTVKRCSEYIGQLFDKAQEFWHYVQTETPPPAGIDETLTITDDEFLAAANRWAEAKRVLDQAKEYENEARMALLELTDGGPCQGGGVKCTPVVKKGAVDYKAIPELQSVNLEQYRKPSSMYWKVEELKR